MRRFLFLILSFIAFSCFEMSVTAINQSGVIISEIAWMGTINSANDEWIELFNSTNNPISVEGWVLKSADGTPEIKLTGTILANEFYLLERTDDNTVPEITADKIYTGALGNGGEGLKLYNNSNILIDQASFSSGWLFGDNSTKQTMERVDLLDRPASNASGSDAGWQTSKEQGGTPKTENSTKTTEGDPRGTPNQRAEEQIANQDALPPLENLTPPSSQILPEQNLGGQTPNITYPTGIIINEILPSPEGADETNEWVELHNANAFEVDLSSWKIQDAEGTITTHALPVNTKIPGNGYLVLKRPETKIVLNNDKDSLNLIQPNGNTVDSVSYEKAPKNQSYNKISGGWPASNASGSDAGWQWSSSLTPGSLNIIESTLPKSNKTDNNMAVASIKDTVNIGDEENFFRNEISGKANPWFLFLVALVLTIISGVVILILKIKIFKKTTK